MNELKPLNRLAYVSVRSQELAETSRRPPCCRRCSADVAKRLIRSARTRATSPSAEVLGSDFILDHGSLVTAGAAGRHRFAPAGIPDCCVLSVACPSLAGARAARVAPTRHHRNVRGRDLHTRRHLTSLQVCRAAEPSPSRLSQSIHPSDSAVCSFDHRKTRMTRASSLLVGLSILEQLRATSGARITLLPPHLA